MLKVTVVAFLDVSTFIPCRLSCSRVELIQYIQQLHQGDVVQKSSTRSRPSALRRRETFRDNTDRESGSLPPQTFRGVATDVKEVQQSVSPDPDPDLDPGGRGTVSGEAEAGTGQQQGNWRNKNEAWLNKKCYFSTVQKVNWSWINLVSSTVWPQCWRTLLIVDS